MIHERSYRLDETGAGYRDIYYLDEKGYLVDAPKAVFRMVRDCLLSGQLLGEHTERIAMATPAARNL